MSKIEITAHGPTGAGTIITDQETGARISNVSRIKITIVPTDVNRAALEFDLVDVGVEGSAEAEYACKFPDGMLKPIKKIIFADGSVWEA